MHAPKNGNSPGTLLEPLEPCPITLQPWNPGTCCWVAKLGNILFLGVAALSIRLRMWSSWLGSRLNLVTHTSTGSLSYSLAFFGILWHSLASSVFEAKQLSWAELGEVKLLADLTRSYGCPNSQEGQSIGGETRPHPKLDS